MNLIILILNISGTLLLSIEAIKLHNLVKFKNRLKNVNSKLNPEIEWVESDVEIKKGHGCTGFIIGIVVCFFPVSFLITYALANKYLEIYWIIGIAVIATSIIWTVTIYLLDLIILITKIIEQNVAKGSIGIFGFTLLMISFLFQYFLQKEML